MDPRVLELYRLIDQHTDAGLEVLRYPSAGHIRSYTPGVLIPSQGIVYSLRSVRSLDNI